MLDFGFARIPAQHQPAAPLLPPLPAHGSRRLRAGTADDGDVSPHPFPVLSGGSRAAKAIPGVSTFPNIKTHPRVPAGSLLHPLPPPAHGPGRAASPGQEAAGPYPRTAQRGSLSLSKQIFQIFLAAPCFPLLSCNKGSKLFFPLGTSSGIN